MDTDRKRYNLYYIYLEDKEKTKMPKKRYELIKKEIRRFVLTRKESLTNGR